MCEEHAKYILEQENLKIPVVLPIEFESTIQMVTGHCPEWSVEPNTTPSVNAQLCTAVCIPLSYRANYRSL